MSEYQYYDFRAIDRALTKAEMAELRSVSTRAVITSTSFTNHYEWGDLKADPLKLLEKYFDTFLYVANWGTRELYLRLPLELADYKVLRAMFPGEAAQVRKSGNSVIVAFENQFEDDDWDDGTGWMGSLMSLARTCCAATSAAFISDGSFVRKMKSSARMNWSQLCLLVWANCQLPSIR